MAPLALKVYAAAACVGFGAGFGWGAAELVAGAGAGAVVGAGVFAVVGCVLGRPDDADRPRLVPVAVGCGRPGVIRAAGVVDGDVASATVVDLVVADADRWWPGPLKASAVAPDAIRMTAAAAPSTSDRRKRGRRPPWRSPPGSGTTTAPGSDSGPLTSSGAVAGSGPGPAWKAAVPSLVGPVSGSGRTVSASGDTVLASGGTVWASGGTVPGSGVTISGSAAMNGVYPVTVELVSVGTTGGSAASAAGGGGGAGDGGSATTCA